MRSSVSPSFTPVTPRKLRATNSKRFAASPRDTDANVRVAIMALAKLYLGAYEDALNLYRRSIELNRNYPNERFNYAATLVELGRLDEKRRPKSKPRLRSILISLSGAIEAAPESDNPVFLKRRERIIEDMRKAGVPEG